MKKISFITVCALLPFGALASDGAKLDLNVRRIGIEWSKTDVKHAAEYQD